MSAAVDVIAIVGPTAVGKTALAIALAQRFNGEIVNADSRQVYTGMDVGTAKPSAYELRVARHHLIDIRTPWEPLSLGEYLPLAHQAITDIAVRGRLPLICGGTGQYVWAILEGWQVPPVPPDPAFRAELESRAAECGSRSLWNELDRLDPQRAASIDPNNTRRVIRALEVERSGREPATRRDKSTQCRHRVLTIGLSAERSALYQRIDERFDRMLDNGLLDEARRLAESGLALGHGPLSGVGYTQIGQYLDGELTLAEAVDRAKTQTHRLVRRQNTWFKLSDPRIVWLDATNHLPVAEAADHLSAFLASKSGCGTIPNQGQ